jgi:hypothetical protein
MKDAANAALSSGSARRPLEEVPGRGDNNGCTGNKF